MLLRPPRSTLTDTLFPYTTRFRSYLYRHQGVAIAAGASLALSGKPHLPAALDPRRQLQVDRLAVGEGDALRLQRRRFLKRNLQPIGDIGAPALRALAKGTAAPPLAAVEQIGEDVAEVPAFAEFEMHAFADRAAETDPSRPRTTQRVR